MAHQSAKESTGEPVLQTLTEVSMRVHRGFPIVDVWINGSGPFNFGVDTGAMSRVIVGGALAEQLELTSVEDSIGGDETAGGRYGDTVPIDSIRVGDLEFEGVSAKSINFPFSRPQIDGILGLSLFKDFLLTLDYPGKCFRVERAELPVADANTVLQLERHPTGLVFLELEVGGETHSALFDTGNLAGAFYLPKSVVTLLEWAGDSRLLNPAHTAGGEITIEEVKLAGEIRVGQLVFSQPVVVFGDTFGRPIIGGQPFSEFVVSIDQRNWRLSLTQ